MNSDFSKGESSLTDRNSKNGEITRRDLLVITAKSAVGLTLAPLSSVLANKQEHNSQNLEVMMSELVTNNTPIGLNLASSATSAICHLAGDIDGDCTVDEKDLKIMCDEWLTNDASAISNLDGSYTYIPGPGSAASAVYVDFDDYSILANDWGKSCSACSAISFLGVRRSWQRRFRNLARQRFAELIHEKIKLV